VRYWERPPEAAAAREAFYQQSEKICALYHRAFALQEQGTHLISTDEKTGIQAIERTQLTLPMYPGRIEYQEFEYKRHGTQCLIANLDVATGQLLRPTIGPTRTEVDFEHHIEQTLSIDPEGEWIFIVDQLNTHQSESLVRLVARHCDLAIELGIKGKSGILQSKKTRAQFLMDETHRIRLAYTPKHASWLNQIECWFSILVRRLLKRASCTSVEELKQRIVDFIDYFNKTMAKPFKWTYKGRPLEV
jgi:transposase